MKKDQTKNLVYLAVCLVLAVFVTVRNIVMKDPELKAAEAISAEAANPNKMFATYVALGLLVALALYFAWKSFAPQPKAGELTERPTEPEA